MKRDHSILSLLSTGQHVSQPGMNGCCYVVGTTIMMIHHFRIYNIRIPDEIDKVGSSIHVACIFHSFLVMCGIRMILGIGL